ncbi:hypothetical protein chiPu_0023950 [Chiloscyllium punctatum]|uniref:Uncharacterized protein n=1 Tax=Chiloscyllium punctatum TaxID=137246 RepID=A0A401TB10_CHIPU|nr:hypothetical protein [Chiloscyllium punctatum]
MKTGWNRARPGPARPPSPRLQGHARDRHNNRSRGFTRPPARPVGPARFPARPVGPARFPGPPSGWSPG